MHPRTFLDKLNDDILKLRKKNGAIDVAFKISVTHMLNTIGNQIKNLSVSYQNQKTGGSRTYESSRAKQGAMMNLHH